MIYEVEIIETNSTCLEVEAESAAEAADIAASLLEQGEVEMCGEPHYYIESIVEQED